MASAISAARSAAPSRRSSVRIDMARRAYPEARRASTGGLTLESEIHVRGHRRASNALTRSS